MAKDKVFIQRYWKTEFFEPIAVSGSIDDSTQVSIKTELAKEVEWVVRSPDFETNAILRIDKIDALLAANEDDITEFDQYSQYRRLFFEWILA